ncbi:helix-turn-helix domain-containing protein [uncultured Marinobacter sp.]|uniref:helix-turn-helix domain-containing protein n=1 Tax=uncultured Marinobacter sp. TaxID=187379 RepID=UPI0030D9BB51|tara:strand:+ start:26145 stop:28445 length:2301 start_codon:yes stop_codon:yes gene_type:complete
MQKVKIRGHPVAVSQKPATGQFAPVLEFVGELSEALRAMSNAALASEREVKEIAAERVSALLGGHDAIVIERSGGGWCCPSGCHSRLGERVAEVPETLSTSHDIVCLPKLGTFISVTPGVGVLTDHQDIDADRASLLRLLAIGFNLALTAANRNGGSLDTIDEIGSLQGIAKRILSAKDSEEVIFSIVREGARLLDADIGGVFLRDGDELVMRGCVGNDTLDVGRLRMKRGQGLAGRVFGTERPCKVDDYFGDRLSDDFFWLAQNESIRCAAGAPLLDDSEGVIGVLEVWRRRSVSFTDQDLQRLVTLANLTSVAIQNAALYENQQSIMLQLAKANEDLHRQNDLVRLSSQLQDDLIGALLDNGGAVAIVRIVARYAAVEVAILGSDLGVMAAYPACAAESNWKTRVEAASLQLSEHTNNTTVIERCQDAWLLARPIIVGGNSTGWVCALSPTVPDDIHKIAMRQAAAASALYYLEQRAASEARASALEALMWDLLEGTSSIRQSALDRLKDFHIDLQGPYRVVHGMIENLAETAQCEGWNMDTVEFKLRTVREACKRSLSSGALKLIASRGDLVVAVISGVDAARVNRVFKSVHKEILETEGVRTFWGVSAPCELPSQLPDANDEAQSAVRAVVKLGTPTNPVVIYEHLGILALLLQGSGGERGGDGRGARAFVSRMLAPMFKYDSTHHGVLAKTVRAYLSNDCSLKLTARRLYVHDKTVRYRLSQFEEMTGVDLRRHRERMSVDLALMMHDFAIRSTDGSDDKS